MESLVFDAGVEDDVDGVVAVVVVAAAAECRISFANVRFLGRLLPAVGVALLLRARPVSGRVAGRILQFFGVLCAGGRLRLRRLAVCGGLWVGTRTGTGVVDFVGVVVLVVVFDDDDYDEQRNGSSLGGYMEGC